MMSEGRGMVVSVCFCLCICVGAISKLLSIRASKI